MEERTRSTAQCRCDRTIAASAQLSTSQTPSSNAAKSSGRSRYSRPGPRGNIHPSSRAPRNLVARGLTNPPPSQHGSEDEHLSELARASQGSHRKQGSPIWLG
jgi:hypothetical protein